MPIDWCTNDIVAAINWSLWLQLMYTYLFGSFNQSANERKKMGQSMNETKSKKTLTNECKNAE